jgi:porphobilinogen deaminase
MSYDFLRINSQTPIRIGTRKSPLALWQAQQAQAALTALG